MSVCQVVRGRQIACAAARGFDARRICTRIRTARGVDSSSRPRAHPRERFRGCETGITLTLRTLRGLIGGGAGLYMRSEAKMERKQKREIAGKCDGDSDSDGWMRGGSKKETEKNAGGCDGDSETSVLVRNQGRGQGVARWQRDRVVWCGGVLCAASGEAVDRGCAGKGCKRAGEGAVTGRGAAAPRRGARVGHRRRSDARRTVHWVSRSDEGLDCIRVPAAAAVVRGAALHGGRRGVGIVGVVRAPLALVRPRDVRRM